MDDQGQYIVDLAHELLRTNFVPVSDEAVAELLPAHGAARKPMLSLKTLCLATLLTAFGSSAVTAWAMTVSHPLNHYQKTELNALVFYAARLRNVNETLLRRDLELEFGVESFDDLTGYDYIFARRYWQALAQ